MIALDTSVVVAGLLEWHESHTQCFAALDKALGSKSGVLLPVPALVESYAVMTRLPAPHRLSAADAFAILRETFDGSARLVSLEGKGLWSELGGWSKDQVSGGRTYDAHILACARIAGAQRLLTLNDSDFVALAAEGIEIVVPGSDG